jgi:hypothetical protein
MKPVSRKKQTLLGLLIVFVITLVALLLTYSIKYLFKSEPPKIDSPPDTAESQPPLSSSQILQILKELENKVFLETESFELTEKEIRCLDYLSKLEINNPILQNSEKIQVIQGLSEDLKRASDAYKRYRVNLDLTTLGAKDIKSFQTLSERKVSCFLRIRKDLKKKSENAKPKDIEKSKNTIKGYPLIDFRLHGPYVSELSATYPDFSVHYQILSNPFADLKELLRILLIYEQYCEQSVKALPSVSNFTLNLSSMFFSICSYRLKNNPNELFNIFNEDFTLLLVFTGLKEMIFQSIYFIS